MSLGEHLAQLLGGLRALEPLDVPLDAALGSRLAADIPAPRPVPHFPVCVSSGYAVRSGDASVGASLRVIDDVAPGFTSSQPVYSGVCVTVHEGALLPKGADAVVPMSGAARNGDTAIISRSVAPGTGVAAPGSEVAQGVSLMGAGRTVDATAIGLLASAGVSRVSIRPQPRVVVVTVGNGLVAAKSPATEGLLFDAAGPMLTAAAAQAGAMASRVGPVPAEDRALRSALDDQLVRADLIVVSGGSEVAEPGVRNYLTALGTVTYDDGSTSLGPFGHGVLGEDRIPVLALPVHPVRAAMLFSVIAVPMLRAMRGVGPMRPTTVTLGAEVMRRPGITTLLLARITGEGVALPFGRLTPSPADYAAADAIIRVLPGNGIMAAGSRIPAMLIGSESHGDGR